MTTFVLVHGAWHGPWAWDRVTPLLERAGASVLTPALTPDGDVGLHDHVEELVAVLDGADRSRGEVVLVGHSYAGLVVRQAADRRPDLVDQIILVEGWAGGDGASMVSLAPEWRAAGQDGPGGPVIPVLPPEVFGITDPDDAAWLEPRLRPHPFRTFTEATRLTGAVEEIPGTGVYCRPQIFPFERMAVDVGYRTVAMDGPHDVMISHPEPLAGLLLEIAAGTGRAPVPA